MKNGEEYLCHDDIAMNLGGIDSEGCNRVAGSKFSVLRGPLSRLERALGQWFLDIHTKVVVYHHMLSICNNKFFVYCYPVDLFPPIHASHRNLGPWIYRNECAIYCY